MPRHRVLALHSFRMSGAIMRRQLFEFSNIGDELSELLEIHFIDGSHRCTPEEEARLEKGIKPLFGEGPFYEWLNASPDPGDANARIYDHIDASVHHIAAYVARSA